MFSVFSFSTPAPQRSRDSGGREEGTEVKQQLGSLEFIKRVIDNRINRLDKGSETDSMGEAGRTD